MAKSIKLKDNTYIDSTGVSHNRDTLKNVLNNMNTNINKSLERTFFEAYYTSNFNIDQEWKKVAFGGCASYGDKLEFKNGRIYVKKGVTCVKVSAIAFLENMNSSHVDYVWLQIQKNGGGISGSITSGTSDYYQSVVCPELITWVNEGDYFELVFNNPSYNNGNTPVVRAWGDSTRLCVEVLA